MFRRKTCSCSSQTPYWLAVVVVIFIFIVYIVLNEINTHIVQMNKNMTDYFLFSVRSANDFDEKNVDWYKKHFRFSRSLYSIEFDDRTWENDHDLFLQSCIVSLSLLSHYVDRTSIFYRDAAIWRMLLFVNHVFCMHMTAETCGRVHQVYQSLLLSMYVHGAAGRHSTLLEDFDDYFRWYALRCTGGVPQAEPEHFPHYVRYIDMCERFNDKLLKTLSTQS